LGRIELIFGGVVEIDEVYTAGDPVKISFQFVVGRVIEEPLLAQWFLFKPIGKLDDVLLARFRRNCFMVANAEKYGESAEGSDLILQEVVPGELFVIANADRRNEVFGLVLDVFVEIIDSAEITQMPVKRGARLQHAWSNGGHHDITAISGIAGNSEAE
jgi:hypothetical protein